MTSQSKRKLALRSVKPHAGAKDKARAAKARVQLYLRCFGVPDGWAVDRLKAELSRPDGVIPIARGW